MMVLSPGARAWVARLAVAAVFIVNVRCAVDFIVWPQRYMGGFELGGIPGEVAVRGFGIMFLMWNAAYVPVIIDPLRRRVLFGVIIIQQVIGLLGESWLLSTVPEAYPALRGSIVRFIVYDGANLVILLLAWLVTKGVRSHSPVETHE